MSETHIVHGRFTDPLQISEVISCRAVASADNDLKLSLNLSKNFSGSIILQRCVSGTDHWSDVRTFTGGGSYNEIFEALTDYRLFCDSLKNGSVIIFDLFVNSTTRRTEYRSPQYSHALATWAGSVAGIASAANEAGTLAFPSVRNAKPSNTKQLRQGKARVSTGAGNFALLFVGMSTFFGQGAGTSIKGLTGCKAKSTPTKLAAKLAANGLKAHAHSWFGNGNQVTVAELSAADPRLVFNSGWAPSTAFFTIACRSLLNSTNTNTMTFAPAGNVDTFRTYYARGASSDVAVQQIDSEALDEFNTQGSSLIIADTVTSNAGVGTKVLKIKRKGTLTNLFVVGMRAWDSTSAAVEVINMGWASGSSSEWASTASNLAPLTATEAVITDLIATGVPTVVMLGMDLNDIIEVKNGTITVSEYIGYMQALISGFQTAGADVVLVTGNHMLTSSYQAAQRQILAAQNRLADQYDVPIIDIADRYISYEDANAMGFMYDTIHPNDRGYDDQATLLANFITNV